MMNKSWYVMKGVIREPEMELLDSSKTASSL